jgi:hypothetical protein
VEQGAGSMAKVGIRNEKVETRNAECFQKPTKKRLKN